MTYQRGKKGNYHYDFRINGKRSCGVCEGCKTKAEADAYEAKLKQIVKEGAVQKRVQQFTNALKDKLFPSSTITLSDAYEHYLRIPAAKVPGEEQKKRNRTYWLDFVKYMSALYPETKNIAEVTKEQAESYVQHLREHGPYIQEITAVREEKTLRFSRKATLLRAKTINARHKAVKAVFERLRERTGILQNPFQIPMLPLETKHKEIFTEEEVQLLSENVAMPYTKPLFIVGISTGLTEGDICCLKWSEIQDGWIRNKLRRKTKTPLEIPIPPVLQKFFDEQIPVSGSSEYVFPELVALYQRDPTAVNKEFSHLLKRLGIVTTTAPEEGKKAIATLGVHSLRHTYAAHAAENNVPITVIQSLLGHKSIEMTGIYAQHTNMAQKQQFLSRLSPWQGIDQEPPIEVEAKELEPSSSVTCSKENGKIDLELERQALCEIARTADLELVKALLAQCEVSYTPIAPKNLTFKSDTNDFGLVQPDIFCIPMSM